MLLLSKFRIYGHSMAPVLNENDLVLISYIPFLFKKPKVNDVVAISYNGKILIKRIKEKREKKYFVNGDNMTDSLDSRNFGFISSKQILGKLILKIK